MQGLIILKTSPETIKQVVAEKKHALKGRLRRAKPNDLILIAEIQPPGHGPAIARYGMWFTEQRAAFPGEVAGIWKEENTHRWNIIVKGRECQELSTQFSPEAEKITKKNYSDGGTLVYVCPDDANLWRQKGLLEPFFQPQA